MALTNDQLAALSFGYLTGDDLITWCPPALLIKALEVRGTALTKACDTAYAEITAATVNRYDIATELAKTGGDRSTLCVKIASILAVANSVGNAQAISEKMTMDIKQARKDLIDIRNAQLQLPLQPVPLPVPPVDPITGCPNPYSASSANLVHSSFKTMG